MQRFAALGLTAVWLIGCGSSSLSPAAARLVEGEDADLEDCTLLQRVRGDGDGEATAKNAARENAAKLGATHIRWVVPCCTSVEANAYRCDVPET